MVRTNFFIAMGMDSSQYDSFVENMEPGYPLGRVGDTKDITNVMLFLASEECSWVTGINFLSDGGCLNAPVNFEK